MPDPPIPARTIEWVRRVTGATRITSPRKLHGGTSSTVHALTAHFEDKTRTQLVLRRYTHARVIEEEPDLPQREAHTLRALTTSALPVANVISHDQHARHADVPAILITKLRGAIDLAPRNLDAHVRALATLLPRLHAVRPARTTPPYARYHTSPYVPPSRTRNIEAWRAIIERASQPPPPSPSVFIHRDYHPGNVLWSPTRGAPRISGVVDWVNASVGSPLIDVGHMRWNLAVLHGVPAADAFLTAYLDATGTHTHDPYWDIVCLLDISYDRFDGSQWRDAGRLDLTDALARRRLDAYARSLTKRL